MAGQVIRLPSRKWSIVALSSAGLAIVLFSYLLAIAVAIACLLIPYFLFVVVPIGDANFMFGRLLISAFGLAVGLSILWSLLPQKSRFDPGGVLINLAKERRLAREIEAIASALREPMPTEVYLLADANAFVMETSGLTGIGNRRVMGLGLPLLQMLPIAQFRAILAHEFGHYYAGDTRLGPWVYNTRRAMVRAFENLGKKSDVLRFLRRWAIVSILHRMLMAAMRSYWQIFMRVTQAISRRQEFRSDELACYVAGSQALIDGLEGVRRCQAGLQSYWGSYVVPAAMSGYQPALADGFRRFMQSPQIVKAASEYLAQQAAGIKTSPFDSHPPLDKRIEAAKRLNLPAPDAFAEESASGQPMISLIDGLDPLETSLLKKLVPAAAASDLKPLNWETDGAAIYIPIWRKQVAPFLPFLATRRLGDFPLLVLDPKRVASLIPDPPGVRLNQNQRAARALDILYCAFALCLLENGWKLTTQPGSLVIENGEAKVEPGSVVAAIRAGKLSVVDWSNFRLQRGIGDWALAQPVAIRSAS
jgi:heat shock protein HtpX